MAVVGVPVVRPDGHVRVDEHDREQAGHHQQQRGKAEEKQEGRRLHRQQRHVHRPDEQHTGTAGPASWGQPVSPLDGAVGG